MDKLKNKEWLEAELLLKSQSQIAEEIQTSRYAVYKFMKIHGIVSQGHLGPRKKSSVPPKIKYSELQDPEWLREELKTKSKLQIAEEIGCTYSAVTFMANKYGINTGRSGPRRKSETRSESIRSSIRERYPNGRKGEDSPVWKGGRSLTGADQQYFCMLKPEHPFANKRGYVMEHRLVMEAHIGRYLTLKEIVHHLDGDGHNNKIENLQLTTKKKHFQDHFNAVKEVKGVKQKNTQLEQENTQLKVEVARLKK